MKRYSLRTLNKVFLAIIIFVLGYCVGPEYAPVSLSKPQITRVCFTPHQKCLPLVLNKIYEAQKEILVQAYSLTSRPLIEALRNAYDRGLRVSIILEASRKKEVLYSPIHDLVYLEKMPGLAHNKVIIIDDQTVITGSYNFTHSAEYRNAENLLIIEDPKVVASYKANWQKHFQKSFKMK